MHWLLQPARQYTQALLLAAILLNSACVSMIPTQDPLESFISKQQPAQALAVLEQEKVNARDQVLYHLNKAVLLRMDKELNSSNAELETAKQLSQKLDAVSLREQATAISVNDTMRSYLPPPFELAMLYCLKIINYLELNDINNARVETLQLDVFLQQKIDEQEPPFARYLSGLVFEANYELSDALIAYRKAYEAYQTATLKIPLQLQADLLRLTDQQGLKDEHQRYLEEFKLEDWPRQADLNQQGEYVVIVFNGLIPHKHSTSISVQSPRDGQLHRIAIPFYEERKSQVANMSLVSANQIQRSELFARIDQQADANMKQQIPGIITRTVARAAVKNNLSDNMAKKNSLLGTITNIAGFILEQADTRSWNTLPQEILVSRLTLPPGEYNIDIKLQSANQAGIVSKETQPVSLQRKQKQFYSWHWPASTVTSKEYSNANTSFSTTVRHRIN